MVPTVEGPVAMPPIDLVPLLLGQEVLLLADWLAHMTIFLESGV